MLYILLVFLIFAIAFVISFCFGEAIYQKIKNIWLQFSTDDQENED